VRTELVHLPLCEIRSNEAFSIEQLIQKVNKQRQTPCENSTKILSLLLTNETTVQPPFIPKIIDYLKEGQTNQRKVSDFKKTMTKLSYDKRC
jgi:hypothetical protein